MKKQLFSNVVIALAGIGLFAGSALATPTPAPPAGYTWNSADYWEVTDLANSEPYDTSGLFEMRWLNDGASFNSSFGIYAFEDTSKSIELFGFNAAVGSETNIYFKENAGTWQVSLEADDNYMDFTSAFGFYGAVDQNNDGITDFTYYTDIDFNVDNNTEHFAIAFKEPNSGRIYFEDAYGRSIDDANDISDLLVGSSDMQPIPEPATMLLFGVGLVGLASIRRKK